MAKQTKMKMPVSSNPMMGANPMMAAKPMMSPAVKAPPAKMVSYGKKPTNMKKK